MNSLLKHKKLLIIAHLLIGYLGVLSPILLKIFVVVLIAFSLINIYVSKNENEEAILLSSYFVGAEVFLRMADGLILYESCKYLVILFLTIGIFVKKDKQSYNVVFIFYFLLLLLGIVFTKVPEGESIRKAILFNLSGPILLGFAALYSYRRRIKRSQLLNALFLMTLPVVSMSLYLYFKTPSLSEIVFGGVANFDASGGFGPNQVSTILGIGVFILTVFLIEKFKFSGFVILDALFLGYFVFRGLITFSRGGMVTAVICIIIFYLLHTSYFKRFTKSFYKFLIAGSLIIVAIWLYTSNITGGMLNNRYLGKNARGVEKEDISSGRINILEDQIFTFIENPLGIGVGNGKYKRARAEDLTNVSHNEIGRLLEEHGLIGLLLFTILIFTPLFNIFRSNNYQRAYTVSFYLIWFLTINHSAMRVALPGFFYALSLIVIQEDE